MKNFWNALSKPFFVMAPLANVTDAAFRRVLVGYGKPDVLFTEFVSDDGLFCSDLRAREVLMKDLQFAESERPIVAQFFTAKPELMERAARLAVELGFDGIDINMGCPDRGVEKQGAGAALMKHPNLAQEIIDAAQQGAGDLPVSVKTRIGYNKNELDTWLPTLLTMKPVVVTLHARTRKEMSAVPAHWDAVARAVAIRNDMQSETLIVGNGDVADFADARQKAEESGADGVMLGRAVFQNPWVFATSEAPAVSERLEALIEHIQMFENLLGDVKHFSTMQRRFKWYVSGFAGSKELRTALMETNDANEAITILQSYIDIRR